MSSKPAASSPTPPGNVPFEARGDFLDNAPAELLLERWGPPAHVARDRGGRRLAPPSRNLQIRTFDAAAFAADPHANQIWVYDHTHRGRLRLRFPVRSFLVFRHGIVVGGWQEEQTEPGKWSEIDVRARRV